MARHYFTRLLRDRAGNFGIITAFAIPVLLAVAGVSIDLTSAMERKIRLQALADSAALAAASAMAESGEMTEDEAEVLGANYLIGQTLEEEKKRGASDEELEKLRKELEKNLGVTAAITKVSGTADSYDVNVKLKYDFALNPLTALLGMKTMTLAVESTAESGREGNALSMYLVLDESGSMAYDTSTVNAAQPTKEVTTEYWEQVCPKKGRCDYEKKYKTETVTNYVTKMESLKSAAVVMFSELKAADPAGTLIRVGADSYTHETKDEEPIAWGTTKVEAYVKNLPDVPAGGTSASGAMANAFAALKSANATEKTRHAEKGNTGFSRFIVFMTDGEMTGYSNKWNETIHNQVKAICSQAKTDGIKIYSIAFMAPTNGKTLLNDCSSGTGYYYEPSDMAGLVKSFGEIARKAAKTDTRLTH